MKSSVKVWLIVLLVVLAVGVIFVSWRYFWAVNKLVKTETELEQSRLQLFKELQEKQQLQNELKETRGQLHEIKIELENTKKELTLVNTRLLGVEKYSKELLQKKQRLEEKLHSLKELKGAIRQVKLDNQQQKVQQYLINKRHQEAIDAQKLAQGNRGFLIKDGRTLFKPKIKIEVKAAE